MGQSLVFPGNLTMRPSASLEIGGNTLDIGGNLNITISNVPGDGLLMTNAADAVTVTGNALFTVAANNGGATSEGNFVAGTLRLGGNFTQTRDNTASSHLGFASTGTLVVFDGTGAQTVSFSSPTLAQSAICGREN